MALRNVKCIFKVIFASAILLVLNILAKWPYLFNHVLLKPWEMHNGQESIANSMTGNKMVGRKTRFFNYSASDDKYETTSESKTHTHGKMVPSDEMMENIYGSDCPFNPHKQTLNYLFNYWMALDNYYNFSSFLCGGSLIGSLRDGDLIPYDRDIDVCVTMENYQKVRVIRSGKPFDYRSSQIYLAVQEDFSNNNVSSRTLVDCWGRIVQPSRDPCSFDTPGARLISRRVYVDVFVFREHGRRLRDHEYGKNHLKTDIFPLKHCTFMGVKTKCPRNEMSLLLKYYEPDVLTKPHYKCENKTWVATSEDANKQFKIWFNKRLKRLYS
jgi:hypothetical protein